MATAEKLIRRVRFDKRKKELSMIDRIVWKDTTMSIQEIQNFLAPIKANMETVSKGDGWFEFDDWTHIFINLVDFDRRSDCGKLFCFLPHIVASFAGIPMIPLYLPYLLFYAFFWLFRGRYLKIEKEEAENEMDKFFQGTIETFHPKDLRWIYNSDSCQVHVYGIMRGEEAERELEERRRRARNEEIQRQEDENQRRRNMMMVFAMNNMINNQIHNLQESVENINERNRTIIEMANTSYANELQQQQQQQSHSVRESMGQTTGRGSTNGPTTGTTTGAKSERTERGFFKVSGWGCDALFQKTNGTVTRCNSKGDPSNQGEFLVVQTTKNPMSIRFESEGTWVTVPAQSKQFFVRIPPQLMSEKWITIEAHYTPSY